MTSVVALLMLCASAGLAQTTTRVASPDVHCSEHAHCEVNYNGKIQFVVNGLRKQDVERIVAREFAKSGDWQRRAAAELEEIKRTIARVEADLRAVRAETAALHEAQRELSADRKEELQAAEENERVARMALEQGRLALAVSSARTAMDLVKRRIGHGGHHADTDGRTIAAWALGIGGAVSVAAAITAGIAAKSKYDEARDLCDGRTTGCSAPALARESSARRYATIANVTGAVGLAAIGVSVALVLTAPEPKGSGADTAFAGVSIRPSRRGAEVAWGGTF